MNDIELGGQKPTRVLLIGFDGIEPTLVREWINDGKLPTFQRLFADSMTVPLESPWGLGSGAMWPSISTSLNPGNNGMYFFRHLVPGTYRTAPADETQTTGVSFWEAAGNSGKRVVILDVPKARRPNSLNGLMVCDWLGHGEIYSEPVSFPAGFIDDVISRYGQNPTGPCDITGRTQAEYLEFIAGLKQRVQMKKSLTLDLLTTESWDLFVTNFGESHCVGHHCWHLHDPSHVDHDPATVKLTGDPILDVYVALDSALAEIVDASPDDAEIMILLGPGMGPNYNGERGLEEILRYLDNVPAPAARKGLNFLKPLWRRLPTKLRRRLSRVAERVDESSVEADRAARRFFAIPGNHSHAAIRINLKGRDPAGLVEPGEEYDAVCADLTSALKELVNLDTGKPVFTEIRRAVDSFHGSRADILPDLMAAWDRSAPITRIFSDRIGTVETEYREFRSGDHTMNCELMVLGRQSSQIRVNARPRTEDVGATIAKLLDSDIPGAEGQALDPLFFEIGQQDRQH